MEALQARQDMDELRDRLSQVELAMVAYQAPNGELRSEPLPLARVDADGNLWFFVSADSPLVSGVARNPRINLSYLNPADGNQLAVGGEATLLYNADLQDSLWRDKLREYFPMGPRSQQVALVRLKARFAEYWAEPRGRWLRVLWRMVDSASHDSFEERAHREVTFPGQKLH